MLKPKKGVVPGQNGPSSSSVVTAATSDNKALLALTVVFAVIAGLLGVALVYTQCIKNPASPRPGQDNLARRESE